MNQAKTTVFDLSPAEKLQLLEDLWDDLTFEPGNIPVHEWHKEELLKRKAYLLQNPESGLSWDEVKKNIRKRYKR